MRIANATLIADVTLTGVGTQCAPYSYLGSNLLAEFNRVEKQIFKGFYQQNRKGEKYKWSVQHQQ
ncbi:hypothetical protein [Microcoleus sp.]|uniref:hypothetical protein n=1 Tax=Microcoleus sp. TaxID=44472 RepID=UPI003594598F